jgi:hypothetical protein
VEEARRLRTSARRWGLAAQLDGNAAVEEGGDGSGAPVVDRKSYSGSAQKLVPRWRRGDGEDGAAATHHDMETRQPSREEDSEVSTSLEKMEVTRPFLPNTYGR